MVLMVFAVTVLMKMNDWKITKSADVDAYKNQTSIERSSIVKPHLYKFYGLWHCFSNDEQTVGVSIDLVCAYYDWIFENELQQYEAQRKQPNQFAINKATNKGYS